MSGGKSCCPMEKPESAPKCRKKRVAKVYGEAANRLLANLLERPLGVYAIEGWGIYAHRRLRAGAADQNWGWGALRKTHTHAPTHTAHSEPTQPVKGWCGAKPGVCGASGNW